MSYEAIGTEVRGARLSIRRLLGLHEHHFGAWTSLWAKPEADGRMTLLKSRECDVCRLAQFRSERVDTPDAGFPHALHLNSAAPRLDRRP